MTEIDIEAIQADAAKRQLDEDDDETSPPTIIISTTITHIGIGLTIQVLSAEQADEAGEAFRAGSEIVTRARMLALSEAQILDLVEKYGVDIVGAGQQVR